MGHKNKFSGMIFNYKTTKLVSVSETLKNVMLFINNQTAFSEVFQGVDVDEVKTYLDENKRYEGEVSVLDKTLKFHIEKAILGEELLLVVLFESSIQNFLIDESENHAFPYLYLNGEFKIINISNNYKDYFKCCGNSLNKPFYHNYINSFDLEFYSELKNNVMKNKIWAGQIKAEVENGQYEEFVALITPVVEYNLNLGYIVKYFPTKTMCNLKEEPKNIYTKKNLLNLITKKLLTNLSKKKYIVFIDYNNFKEINDKYGHLSGDQAIDELKNLICKTFPTDYVSGYGGDEFIIFVDREINNDELIEKLKTIETLSNSELTYKASKTKYQLSVGVSKYPTNGITANDLIYSADLAMYVAKREKTLYKLAFDVDKD